MSLAHREKVNILMVDDQPGKLLTYEAILADLGETLLKALSPNEALDCLLSTDVALILMDVSMPEVDGFQLADMIHEHPRFREINIIFVSGIHSTDLDRLQGYEHGAVDYIAVPVIPELLRAKVRVFAKLHRQKKQLQTLSREMQNLSSRLITMQDEERRRIARELHDSLGQELVAAKMLVESIQKVDRLPEAKALAEEGTGSIDNAIKQVRSMSYLLHPPLLDEVGLYSAIRGYLEGLGKRSGIQTHLEVQPPGFPRLGLELETALYRIVQEALTNVCRHSGAGNAWVALRRNRNQVLVSIRDDGKGIADHVVDLRPEGIGVGIGGMKQRIAEFGGELRLQNMTPGTLVELSVPVSEDRVLSSAVP
jgi:signal transduction histidine kinase